MCLSIKAAETSWRWHARNGHLSLLALQKLSKGEMVCGLPAIDDISKVCDDCLISKQKRAPFLSQASYRATKHHELVHGDLCGPIKPETPGGRSLFLLLVDDMSCYMWLKLLQAKSDAAEVIKHAKIQPEAESGACMPVLWMDRGGEFTSATFKEYYNNVGLQWHLTVPYSPQ
jgi:hypothetical protein